MRGNRGGNRGGFNGNRRDNRGGNRNNRNDGPPTGEFVSFGKYLHPSEKYMVFETTNMEQYPYFNAQVFSEDKKEIGKVDEIFGQLGKFYFTVLPVEGVKPDSFEKGQLLYIYTDKMLPITRLTQPAPPKAPSGGRGGNKGNSRGGQRGNNNRGGNRGSFNGNRGGNRGSFGGNRGGQRGGRKF